MGAISMTTVVRPAVSRRSRVAPPRPRHAQPKRTVSQTSITGAVDRATRQMQPVERPQNAAMPSAIPERPDPHALPIAPVRPMIVPPRQNVLSNPLANQAGGRGATADAGARHRAVPAQRQERVAIRRATVMKRIPAVP